jgi:hypothetical protein
MKSKMKFLWFILTGVLILVWLFFPSIFNWWAVHIWNVPVDQLDEVSKLGPLGDIYGSLNTLISSIALCAVAFSTWLQVTSLKETRIAYERQFKLAEDVHNEQIKESREAVFANKFYSLLNYKKDKLNNIELTLKNNEKVKAYIVIIKLSMMFGNEFRENNFKENSIKDLRVCFFEMSLRICSDPISPIISYFYAYIDIINLIKNAKIPEDDKDFYRSVLSNSMFQEEQIVLFWIAPMFANLRHILIDSEIFNMFSAQENYIEYALKYHDISSFRIEEWKKVFIENNNTST